MKKIIVFVCLALSVICMIFFTAACTNDNVTEPDGQVQAEQNNGEEPAGTPDETENADPEEQTDVQPEEQSEDPSEQPSEEEPEEPAEEPAEESEEPAEEPAEEVSLNVIPLRIPDEEPDWNADYNKPKVEFDAIVPGLVAQNVYVGKDGWMFYGATIDDYTGNYKYGPNRLKFISDRFVERLEFCEENGIKLYFVVTPNKNSVYPEYMATEGVEMAETRGIDVVLDYLKENSGVTIIDCRDGLFAAKEARPEENLYYKLDTHWNTHGGFAAYTQIMDVISKDFPNAVTHTRDEYQIDYFDSYMKDEAYYLGWYDTITEEGPVYTLKNGTTAKMTYRKDSGPYGEFIHAYIHEDGYRDKTDYCSFENTAISDAPSVYVIRDSFGIALLPFLKESFSQSTFSWTLGFDKDDILEKKPDIVIMQVVERSLGDFFNQKAFK
jgi:hypothetical protein